MTDWLRARRAGWCAGAAMAVALVAGLASGRLPSLNLLYRESEGAPLRLVLPALVATALLTVLISPTPRAEFTSTRSPNRELALVGVLAACSAVLAEGIPVAVGDAASPGTFTRNLLGFLGLGLLGRVLIPATIAALIPLAWIIPTLTLARPEGDLIAWPLLPDAADPRGLAAAAVLLGAGLTADHVESRRAPQRFH